MGKFITIIASTINGRIQEFPQTFNLKCNEVIPVDETIVRDFDSNLDIVAKRGFLVRVGEQLLGTTQFKSKEDFLKYKSVNCACCSPSEDCFLYVNGCIVTINGFFVTTNRSN